MHITAEQVYIDKNGLNHLTNMYNAALNDNKIPHVWTLAKIIPIPKPNKDINSGTSYRPISLLYVIAKTLEKVILPYITQNIPNITTKHGFKTKHSTTQHQDCMVEPIPKPNKDINSGTSYRPISLLYVIAKTLEKVILPYITQNIPNITIQHWFKTKHYTNTALHNINNTVATGFNQPIPPTHTIAVALLLLLFATTRSVFKSVKISVVEIAKRTN